MGLLLYPGYLEEDIGHHGEDRRIIIGQSYLAHPVHPLHVVSEERPAEIWRIISAGPAARAERQRRARKDMDSGPGPSQDRSHH